MERNIRELKDRIEELKKEKNAVILAHYYTLPEVQEVADFLGDSLALATKARSIDKETILFAGVHFMAETAKVLCPGKKVLIPRMDAGCSLAESCDAEELGRLKEKHPDYKVVSYVNTTVAVKSLTDICCTSSNALEVVRSIPSSQPIIFTPDRNLGGYIARMTGRDNIILWDGACHVHDSITEDEVRRMKSLHPEAEIVVHPECRREIDDMAHYVGSTAGILGYCERSKAEEFIVVTEEGIMEEMHRRMPKKKFFHISECSSNPECGVCREMKKIQLEDIIQSLEFDIGRIQVEKKCGESALRSIERMIEVQ